MLSPLIRQPARALAVALVLTASLLAGATTASAAVVINEVESDGAADFIELYNTDAADVGVGGYVLKDSNNNNSFTISAGTTIPGNGYLAVNVDVGGGFGLSSGDSARVFTPGGGTLLDSYSWTSHAWGTYGRCPDGTGEMKGTKGATPNAANDCFPAGLAWPGGSAVALADGPAPMFGSNLSGLAYQPSGSSAKGVLWAVRNNPSTLFRLVYDGQNWVPDTANGWSNGKSLRYPDGSGVPDAEGVTLAGGDANAVFVSTERNDDGPNSATSRPAVLRYDVTAAGAGLNATNDWNLNFVPALADANAGLEAVAWVPDELLVAKGFLTGAGTKYNPADYPNHGQGLFFVGVEEDGRILAYALDQTSNNATRVAEIGIPFGTIMDLTYDPETTHLWAVCDNSCNGQTKTLDIAQLGPSAGKFVVTNTHERPAGMPNLNHEGFAIAPQAECVGGFKPVFYADDSNTGGHALRTGTINCTVPAPQPGGGDTGGGGGGGGTGGGGTAPAPAPAPSVDRTAPSLALALKLTQSGSFAVRRTGKFGAVITLGERADLTITATARKNAKAKARTILKTTKQGVAAGKPTLTLALTRKVRSALRKGETLTLTVVARDGAGNATTRTVTAKVR